MADARTLIIGDVHGCIHELDDLLDKLQPDLENDRVIFIGDLINKGPDSRGVIERFHQLGATSILGNHEHRLIEQVEHRGRKSRSFRQLVRSLNGAFLPFVEEVKTWPLFIEEDDVMIVHGGLVPGQHPSETPVDTLVHIRTWDGKGENLQNPKNPPWFDLYTDKRLVVFGHWAALGGIQRDNVIGLDTGCVYGNKLSALILPERKVVTVKARKAYCPVR